MFIGRRKELDELERVYRQDGFHIFVVAGREGAGKTTLIERFCRDKDAIFFSASRESGRANLQRFSKTILSHYKDEDHDIFPFWNSALEYIRDKQQDQKRIILVIDEFAELCDRDSAFLGMFKNCVDKELKDSKIFMIITSSDSKFLQRTFIEKNAPLFSRVTGYLALSQFILTDNMIEQIKEKVVKRSMGMDAAKVVKYSADEVVLREGELNTDMYKIISGKAVCYFGYDTDDEYIVGTLKDGRSFGEYSLLTGKPGIYTVVAFTDLLVLKVGRDEFAKFVEMNANNAVEIMKNMARIINILKLNIDMLRKEAADS